MGVLLSVTDLAKRFGSIPVIEGFSVDVHDGDAVGIVGPNGAGKTTLLNLIAGDHRCDRGTVVFAGRDVTALPAHRRCQSGIGRTSQIPRPFEGLTVFENVLVGATHGAGGRLSGTPQAAAIDAVDRSGMGAKINTLAGSLPLLDRKRLELARALATQPRLLLLDEIAGGLTEAEVLELVDTIRAIHASGVTIVWIEHIVHALLRVVDRIVAMDAGRKLIEGEPAAVMASDEVRSVYLGDDLSADHGVSTRTEQLEDRSGSFGATS
jgi:branched-chain amino acid transport system ATP-binding protein